MIFAAIADIHGNCLALEAVLADIKRLGIDDVVNLGDSFSGPLEAGKTADILTGISALTVMGNHDRALVDRPPEAMGDWERPAFSQLSPVHLAWIAALPFSAIWRDEAWLCHATPQDDNSYWLETPSPHGGFHLRPLDEIEAVAAGLDFPLLLCGHSHLARSVQLSDGRLIVNPGSVGCPCYDDDKPFYHKFEAGHPLACYAVLEKTARGWQPSFRQVRYDNTAMADLAAENGMTGLASAFSGGWIR